MTNEFVGIDVSKARLDVHHGQTEQASAYGNDEEGIVQLLQVLSSAPPRLIVLEATGGLERALDSLRDRLHPGGTFAVIAYHSGEDRVVKNAFRDWSAACICPPRQPVCTCRGQALGTLVTRKSVTASPEEANRNPRSRSARLRAWRSAP